MPFFYITFILLALFLSSLSFLYGAIHPVSNAEYTGMRPINASDYNGYLSRIEQVREGHFLFKNLYTSEPHRGLMARPVTFLLTLPLVFTPLSNVAIYHTLRVLCGLLLLCTLPFLLRTFEKDATVVRIAFLLIAFSSGVDFLWRNFVVPESNLFLSLGEAAHFSFCLALLWWSLSSLYNVAERPVRALVISLVSLALLWWEHPFDSVTLTALMVINVWRFPGFRMRGVAVAGIALVSLPAIYYYRMLSHHPAYSGWSTIQNNMPTPPFPFLLFAFLPMIVLAVPGVVMLWRDGSKRKLLAFLITWILVQAILVHLPFTFQRRLIAGVQFPFALLGAHALRRIGKPLIIAMVLLVTFAGNLAVTNQQIREIRKGEMPFYLPVSYAEAFRWLRSQPKKGGVLCGFVTGNFVPAYTGLAVYAGHTAGTPESAQKKRLLMAFYTKPSREFVSANHIRWVFLGLEERRISKQFPEGLFPEAYRNEEVRILAVPDGTGSN